MLTHYYTLQKLVEELQLLIGCKIIESSSQEKESIVFTFFDSESLHFLHYSGIPNLEALYYSDKFNRKKSNTLDLFSDLLGEILQKIEILQKNRIIKLTFIKHNLYFLFFGGSKNNVILTNVNNLIIDSFSSVKELTGTRFDYPKPNYFNLENLPKDFTLLKALSYSELLLGKYYSEEFLRINGIEKKQLVSEIDDFQLLNLIGKAKIFSSDIMSSTNFQIISKQNGTKEEEILSLIPLSLFPVILTSSSSISELIQRVLISRFRKQKFKEEYSHLFLFAEQEYKRAKRQFQSLESDLLKEELILKYKNYGELLYSCPNLKEKGLKEVNIRDFEGNEISIELNPKYSVIENIEKYYSKIKNLKKSLKINEARKDIIRNEFEISDKRLQELKLLQTLKDISEHYHKYEKFYKSKMTKEEKDISERFKTFVLADNAILYVGKDSKNNDELTFGFGKPNDYWFHLRGGSGSHCILKFTGKGNPSKEIIEKASNIAAYYSSQRNGGFVPVVYTQRKYVRKPKGANPGAVLIAKEEVILVEPKIEF